MSRRLVLLDCYSNESIAEELRRIAALTGRPTVTRKDLKEFGRVDGATLLRRFGTLRHANEAAGLRPNRYTKATREELAGSTITITSLGKLGGIASTPVINSPEVAIVGLNKAVDRPVVQGGAITVRRIMNLSSSFDHRFVDGYDAAAMIQTLKELLEHPATIFIP